MEYAFKHGAKAFTPSGAKNIVDVDTHNKHLETLELAIWATAPDTACVYITKGPSGYQATNWLGTVLGRVITYNSFRTNISRNMVAVRIMGTNGAEYYGRFGADWSQLCRVRKARHG